MSEKFAAYIRFSHENQAEGYTLDAQKRIIDNYVKGLKGKIVEYYIDEAESGRTTNNRDEFLRMRKDARDKKFDALVVAKFDRLNRNRMDAIAVKSLLRKDLGIKVLSATEPSEHDGAVGSLIEGILECVAEWYSLNLSQELKKGKKERAYQGLHNSVSPFGTMKDKAGVLIPNPATYSGLLMAFEMYATGNHSDKDIAAALNQHGYITTQGRLFSTATVRDMLQNKTYTGYVRYSQHIIKPDGRRSQDEPVEWIKAKHDSLVPIELFETCQQQRKHRAKSHASYQKHRVFLLNGITYCWECTQRELSNETRKEKGKMRAAAQGREYNGIGRYSYYICDAKQFGIACSQKSAHSEVIEQEVIDFLMTLKPPADWREKILQSVGQAIGDKQLEQRMLEIRDVITRMDFRWDNGFIANQDEYLEQRLKLQQELDELTPIPTNEIELAADILDNFPAHWQATNADRKAQRELIQTVVERVYVDNKHVSAIVLKPSFFCSLGGYSGYTGTHLESNKRPSDIISSEGHSEDNINADIILHKREGQDSNLRSGITRKTA